MTSGTLYQEAAYRSLIIRCTVVLCLGFMLWRGNCSGLIHQLEQPVLFHTGYDISYWLLRWLHLDDPLLQHKSAAGILVYFFFGSGILLFLYPRQRHWAFLFAASYLLQSLLLNLYLCKTPHVQAGFTVMLWSFCSSRFGQWWRAMRYYVCYIFFTAFIWKLYYGSLFQWNGGFLFFKEYAAPYLFRSPHTALAEIYRWLIQHPVILNAGEKLLFVTQGSFLAGFFTRKYDRFFSVFLILFIFGLLLLGHHFFAELLVLLLPLLRGSDWEWINSRLPQRPRLEKCNPIA